MPVEKNEKDNAEKSKMEISSEKVKEAVNVLKLLNKKFIEEDLKKQPLLEDTAESLIHLQVMLKKIPPPQMLRMIRVPLPHSLMTGTSEVCLITGDLDKRNHKAEIEPTILHYKDLLKKQGVTKVSQVIPLRQLRTEYKTFESRRQLNAAYDVFLVDKKIAGVMGKTLGKSFFQSRKFPIQIDMKKLNLKDQIDKALCQTEFSLTCRGNSYALEVARLSMEDDAIVENIISSFEVITNKIPGNKENLLSLYIKTAKSKAIPIYVSLDFPDNLVIKKPRKNVKCKVDELSTIDNAEVKVFRDGRVVLRKIKKEASICKDTAESDKNGKSLPDVDLMESEDTQVSISNESSLKKKKKSKVSDSNEITNNSEMENNGDIQDSAKASKKKKNKKSDLVVVTTDIITENEEDNQDSSPNKASPKKKKKGKKSVDVNEITDIVEMENEEIPDLDTNEISSKKNKKGRKSILDQISGEAEMKSEGEIQNSPSNVVSLKKNKNRNSIYVETDEALENVQESSVLLSSKKRKISQIDNITEKAKKDKKGKNNTMKNESSVLSIEEGKKTPLKSPKNKKMRKESLEGTPANKSLMSKGKKANVDSDANNSFVKLNRRKSNRKSISVL